MRIFLAVLVFIFSFQSFTKADDIRDFEIEGLSVGESLLNHISKIQIDKLKKQFLDDDEKKFLNKLIVDNYPNLKTEL